jgi:hypothetical protein
MLADSSIARAMKGTFLKKMSVKLAAVACVAAGITLSGSARADEVRGVDWMKVLYNLDQYSRGNSDKPTVTSAVRAPSRPSEDPSPQNMGNAWFGVAPRVTLVARDWASSTRLAGDRLSLVDAMRLSASTRMVVTRVRLSGGTRFTPFVQMGVGQWRVDRNYLPFMPTAIEVASQVGGGVELRVNRRMQLALETTATSLIREGQSPLPQTMLWSTFLASRVEF